MAVDLFHFCNEITWLVERYIVSRESKTHLTGTFDAVPINQSKILTDFVGERNLSHLLHFKYTSDAFFILLIMSKCFLVAVQQQQNFFVQERLYIKEFLILRSKFAKLTFSYLENKRNVTLIEWVKKLGFSFLQCHVKAYSVYDFSPVLTESPPSPPLQHPETSQVMILKLSDFKDTSLRQILQVIPVCCIEVLPW